MASLTGTLSGMDVLSQQEQLRKEMEEANRLRAEQAQAAAQQSLSAYQGAAAAPPPQLSPADVFAPTLLSNIASVLAQDPGYRERAQEGIQQSRAGLLQARAQNLQSLRDVYNQRADEAQRAGDLEQTEKYRSRIASLDKQWEVVTANQKRAQAVEDKEVEHKRDLEKIRLQASLKPATGGAGAFDPDEIQASVDDLAEGRTEITTVPATGGFRRVVQAELRRQGKRIMPKKAREAMNEVATAETVVDEIDALSQQVNTAKANLLSRGITGVKNLGEAMSQSGLAADLETARAGLAGNLARAVSAERGVLTNQDRAFALGLVPSIWTAEDKARRDIARLKRFIQAKRANALKSYTTEGGGAGKPSNGGGKELSDEEAYKRYLKIRSGK